jgi:hypothetical protein
MLPTTLAEDLMTIPTNTVLKLVVSMTPPVRVVLLQRRRKTNERRTRRRARPRSRLIPHQS